MARRPAVTVLGSLNTDISLLVPHLPGPGETVLAAAGATFGAGGKGANQAVAAARLGAAAEMVGCCGDDEFGARLRAGLVAERPDWLVVNAQEAAALAGQSPDAAPGDGGPRPGNGAPGDAGPRPGNGGPADEVARARAVAAGLAEGLGGGHAVVTLGAAGAVLAGPSGTAAVPGFRVTAVDTVGAGDAFVGALAVVLAGGLDPAAAVTAACAAGAAAATRRGAQAALPRPADVLAATGFPWPA